MTGGIGEEDAGVIRANAKKYTLNLLFSEGSSGRWATDINANIYDEASNFVLVLLIIKQLVR